MDRPFHTAYVVCATPRSGSTLLCERLTETGAAGVPQEYFEDLHDPRALPRSPRGYFGGFEDCDWYEGLGEEAQPGRHGGARPRHGRAYAQHLAWAFAEGTTPNGVFGAKMMWGYLPDFLAYAREVPGAGTTLEEVFAGPRYVWVRRRERVRQAVSLWRAVQTATWRRDAHDQRRAGDLVYSERAIGHLCDRIEAHDQAWGDFFRTQGIEPLELVYEDYAPDQAEALHAVFALLGVEEPPPAPAGPPAMRRQSDGISEEFIERFSAARGLPT